MTLNLDIYMVGVSHRHRLPGDENITQNNRPRESYEDQKRFAIRIIVGIC